MVRGRAIGGRGMGVAHLCMCGEHVAQSLEAGADLEAQLLEGAAAPEGGERGERGGPEGEGGRGDRVRGG